MSSKLLLICSRNFPGSLRVLEHLSGILQGIRHCETRFLETSLRKPVFQNVRFVRKLEDNIISKLPPVKISEMVDYGNNIIFAGWDYRYDIILSALNKKSITPHLIMCSTPGQSELTAHELPLLVRIHEHLKSGRLKSVLLNKRLYNSLGKILPGAFFFPHTIDLSKFSSVVPCKLENINIDLFCALRPGKNVLNQILGFKLSGIEGFLHINFNNSNFNRMISMLGTKIVKHCWLPRDRYYALIAGMTLSLQATFTESFSYAVCERMCLRVPVITSCDIDLISDDKFLSEHLCVNALDTPPKIAEKIRAIALDSVLRLDLATRCRQRIEDIAQQDNKYVIDFVNEYFK